MAHYRAGLYREAADILKANLRRQEDQYLAFDLYFLAMSCHQLGDAATARAYFDWALRSVQGQEKLSSKELEELAAFRAEAEQLLGLKVMSDEN